MSQAAKPTRAPDPCASPAPGRFYAYATDDGPCSGHKVPEANDFTEAAVGFLECWGPSETVDTVRVSVIDCETGATQCFRIDLATGATGPC